MDSFVGLKGTNRGLIITLDAYTSLDKIIEELTERLEKVKDFFADGQYGVIISGRELIESEKIKLENIISSIANRQVATVYEMKDYNINDANKVKTNSSAKSDEFHYGTLRSGQTLHSLGNLVVVGDVNPGAELIAVGNVVVMGALRGIVHAGCNGDRNAFVTALRLNPTQLRIADIITRPPDDYINTELVPEIAFIRDNNIYIDRLMVRNEIR